MPSISHYTVISAYFATVSSRFRKMRTQSTVHSPQAARLRCCKAAADTQTDDIAIYSFIVGRSSFIAYMQYRRGRPKAFIARQVPTIGRGKTVSKKRPQCFYNVIIDITNVIKLIYFRRPANRCRSNLNSSAMCIPPKIGMKKAPDHSDAENMNLFRRPRLPWSLVVPV